MKRTAAAAGLVMLAAGACGPAPSAPRGAEVAAAAASPSSGTEAERYFPLVDGRIYHYVTTSDGGSGGLLVARVRRRDPSRGELVFPSGSRHFEYAPDGVTVGVREAGAYVLKAPLALGSAWRGEHGGQTRVTSVDATVVVPAGTYSGCVVTVEERGGDMPVRYSTTFCPDVGIVVLDASSGMGLERAELKSYGEPVRIGPDGTDLVR